MVSHFCGNTRMSYNVNDLTLTCSLNLEKNKMVKLAIQKDAMENMYWWFYLGIYILSYNKIPHSSWRFVPQCMAHSLVESLFYFRLIKDCTYIFFMSLLSARLITVIVMPNKNISYFQVKLEAGESISIYIHQTYEKGIYDS